MKKFLITSPTWLLPLIPMTASAQSLTEGGIHVNKIIINIGDILQTIITLLFVLASLVFVYGVIKFLTAAGNGEAMTAAKGYIMWGLIGMAVLASIFGLIEFIQTFVGVETGSPTEFKPPEIN